MKPIKKPKDKITAIILVIFFGIFGWIYTWHKDWGKFVVALIINMLLFWTIIIPIGLLIWVIVDRAVKPSE